MADYPTRNPALAVGQAARAYRDGITDGRHSAASEIRSAILDALHPDDPPAREHALREAVQIAERNGGLAPIPDSERTGHA